MTPDEILARAADIVEFSGRWVNRQPWKNAETCVLLALREADGIRGTNSVVHGKALSALLQEVDPPRGYDLGAWNDAPGRTAVEVATALRNAKRWLA